MFLQLSFQSSHISFSDDVINFSQGINKHTITLSNLAQSGYKRKTIISTPKYTQEFRTKNPNTKKNILLLLFQPIMFNFSKLASASFEKTPEIVSYSATFRLQTNKKKKTFLFVSGLSRRPKTGSISHDMYNFYDTTHSLGFTQAVTVKTKRKFAKNCRRS